MVHALPRLVRSPLSLFSSSRKPKKKEDRVTCQNGQQHQKKDRKHKKYLTNRLGVQSLDYILDFYLTEVRLHI